MIKSFLDAAEDATPDQNVPEVTLATGADSAVAAEKPVEPFEVPVSSEFFVGKGQYFDDDVSSEQLVRDDFSITAVPDAPVKTELEPEVYSPAVGGTLFQSSAPRESAAETMRKSGLAYSAAIVLGGSVIFMLILGWFVDLFLESSPWGAVGGIIVGAIIGFVQFFRITARIFKE